MAGCKMRWFALILFCGILTVIHADPEPKKYKPDNKDSKSTLTDEERKFLREVEEKFGIKSDVTIDKEKSNDEENKNDGVESKDVKPPFPVVIAFEIVNDTETNTKEKRTIDANLGYGYKTNSGYTYTYFGKPQEKGKLMFYPYSQEDIPPTRPSFSGNKQNKNLPNGAQNARHSKYSNVLSNVEIQPSQAYELVPVQEEQKGYQAKFQSDSKPKYSNVKVTPRPQYAMDENNKERGHTQTLYTTYNGGQISGLSSQFPMVMPNYFVDSSQLLHNAQYQNAGLTSDHLRNHGPQQDQRVVPVLVLRVPSSYLRNPSAELYANLPKDYPISKYLNNVNIQELVNQYFKNIGFSYAPQVMTYQSPIPVPPVNYESQQHYAAPEETPTYTHQDYSGVQYSAVQPVMAKYPMPSQAAYPQQEYYVTQPQASYHQPEQQYEYRYVQPTQAYYYPQYENQQVVYQQNNEQEYSPEYTMPQPEQYAPVSHTQYAQENKQVQYTPSKQETSSSSQFVPSKFDYSTYKKTPALDAGPTKVSLPVYESRKPTPKERESPKTSYGALKSTAAPFSTKIVSASYGIPKKVKTAYVPSKTSTATYIAPKPEYGSSNTVPSHYSVPQSHKSPSSSQEYSYIIPSSLYSEYRASNTGAAEYGVPKRPTIGYVLPKHTEQKETGTVYASIGDQALYKYHRVHPASSAAQSALYQKYIGEDSQSKNIFISENYPSKDHTQVTILPHTFKTTKVPVAVQGVNYVTPQPFSKLHPYNVMVPQTILKGGDKVSYVNAHSLPTQYVQLPANAEYISEEEYKVPASYIPPIGNQKPPSYPQNYHSVPKRMAKKDNKNEANIEQKKEKQPEKKEEKKST